MSKAVYTNDQYYMDIANAIRNKNKSSNKYKPSEMANAINSLVVSGSALNLQDKDVTPSESAQTIKADTNYNGLGTVTVKAIPSSYIGSNVIKNNANSLTVDAETVTVPAGYYQTQVSKSVATGAEGTPIASKGTVSNHTITVTPSVTNMQGYITGGTKTGTAVTIAASELTSGTLSITSNGTQDVTNYKDVEVNIPIGDIINNQNKTINPTTSKQTVSADTGYTGLGIVTVNAIQTEAKTATPTKSSQDISPTSGKYLSKVTVNPIPSDYIIPSGSQTVTANSTYDVTYLTEMIVNVGSTIKNQDKTISPSTSKQTITADSSYTGLGTVTVNAMPGITLPTSASTTKSGMTKATIGRSTSDQYINIPTGYNGSLVSYTISATPNGTAGTPVANKGTVTNNSISITPNVTNTTGYIAGGTKTGTAVTVTASELVNGELNITTNGTKDVTNYASVKVNVGSTIKNQDKEVTPTESLQTVTADSGYTGLGTVSVGAISSSYVGSGISRRNSTNLTASGATVTVPAGYYEAAASKSVDTMTLPSEVSYSSNGTSKMIIHPGWEDTYLNIPTGYNSTASYYTIKGDTNLVPENIKQGVSIFGVMGGAMPDPWLEDGYVYLPDADYYPSIT